MKAKLGWAKWALMGMLLGSVWAAISPAVAAQDAGIVAVKRKVKSKIVPEYPPIARQMHLQGKVKIDVIVSADGHVISTKVLGGHPVLAQSAVEAVKKWRFEPAPKETTETIEMDFSGE